MNTGKYISFIEDVISLLRREDLAEKADQYAAMLDDIKKREGNPCFNVALIGDFSSGKSTFINTFIQRRLLKTAWLATTAVSTFIFYHDENYIKIVAEVTDGKKYRVDLPEEKNCSAKLAAADNENGGNLWADSFDALRRETIKYVNTNRNAIVQSNLKMLIENILKGLDEEVQNCLDTVSRCLEILEKNSISHLSEDMLRNEREYLIKIDVEYAKTDFEAEYKLMFADIQRKADQAIDACKKIRGEGYDSIDGYIKDGFPSMAKNEQDVFSRKINNRLLAVNSLLSEYVAANTELFNAYNVALNYSKSAAAAEKREYSCNVDKLRGQRRAEMD